MDLAEIVVTAGAVLLGAALAWFFFGPRQSSRAELRAGVQEVEVTVKGGYSPNVIRVRQGVPLRGGAATNAGSMTRGPDLLAGVSTLPMVWSPSTSGRTEHHGHPQ